MNSTNENNNTSNGSRSSTSSCNNWLGFSLSPYMKMDSANSSAQQQLHHHHHHHDYSNQQQQYSFLSPPALEEQQQQLNNPSVCFDNGGRGVGENGGYFLSPLTVMPLKSDGSLCIMDDFSRSQPPEGPYIFFIFFCI